MQHIPIHQINPGGGINEYPLDISDRCRHDLPRKAPRTYRSGQQRDPRFPRCPPWPVTDLVLSEVSLLPWYPVVERVALLPCPEPVLYTFVCEPIPYCYLHDVIIQRLRITNAV